MTAGDAIAALTELPDTTRVSKSAVKPGDVIVIETDSMMSRVVAERLTQYCHQIWPDNKVAIFSEGLRVKIAESE